MADTASVPGAARRPADSDVALALLRAGVPLSLLLDLAAAVPSGEIFADEGGDTSWVPARVAG